VDYRYATKVEKTKIRFQNQPWQCNFTAPRPVFCFAIASDSH